MCDSHAKVTGSCLPCSLTHRRACAHTCTHHLKSVNQPNFTLLVLCSFQTGNVKSGNEEYLLHTAKYIKASVERKMPNGN